MKSQTNGQDPLEYMLLVDGGNRGPWKKSIQTKEHAISILKGPHGLKQGPSCYTARTLINLRTNYINIDVIQTHGDLCVTQFYILLICLLNCDRKTFSFPKHL